MPVYLRHKGTWLRIKEVYRIEPVRQRKKRKSSKTTTYSSMLVAESVDKVPLDGLRYKAEIPISSTRVTRFAAQLFLSLPHATILIEPRGEDYVAIVYARSKRELEQLVSQVEHIARMVGVSMEEEEEESVEEEGEEEEE